MESLLIYAIAGAIAVGLSLGLFGSGGSILTVPVLVYVLQHGHKEAIAESLAVVGAVALFSSIPYARVRCVDWRTAIVFGLPGMAGTYLGAWTAAFVPGPVQLLVFAGVMLLAAVQMWRRSSGGEPGAEARKRSIVKIGLDGIAVGVLTGFVGVGGGFLIVPALVLLAGLSMRRAVATSLVIIAVKSAAGFWKYLEMLEQVGSVDWGTIALFTLFGVAGSFAGKSLNGRLRHATLQRGFALFLVVMAGFILVRESASVAAW